MKRCDTVKDLVHWLQDNVHPDTKLLMWPTTEHDQNELGLVPVVVLYQDHEGEDPGAECVILEPASGAFGPQGDMIPKEKLLIRLMEAIPRPLDRAVLLSSYVQDEGPLSEEAAAKVRVLLRPRARTGEQS